MAVKLVSRPWCEEQFTRSSDTPEIIESDLGMVAAIALRVT